MSRKVILRVILVLVCVGIAANSADIYLQIKHYETLKILRLARATATIEKQSPVKNVPAFPTYVRIPSLGIAAKIEAMGVGADGKMQVPEESGAVSWYKLGAQPGAIGNAVLAGHYDNIVGLPAVFYKLNRLKKGDDIVIENSDKSLVRFKVTKSSLYNSKANDQEVFGTTTLARLNLITCAGSWSPTIGGYPKRLVVFSDKIQ